MKLATRFSTKKSIILPLLVALVSAIALSGCNAPHLRSDAAQIPQLVLSALTPPSTFNPAINTSANNVFGLTIEGLTTENGITGEVEPALAQSWEISPNKQQIIFTLRPGLKWSDGQPLTADDVVFTYNEVYFNEKIPTPLRDVLRIGESGALPKVRKLDQRRIEFTLPEAFAPFFRTTSAYILPAHILRDSINEQDSQGKIKFLSQWGVDADPAELVSNGPYIVEEYVTSQRVVFRRNPYYWRRDSQGNAQPYIERVISQIVENQDTALLQFRSRGLHAISVTPENFSLLKREEKRGNFTIYNGGPAMGTTFIAFNLNQGRNADTQRPLVDPIKSRWFNTLEFRQAIAYAIDRETMIDNTFRGLGELQNSPISVQSPYYLPPEKGLKVYEYNPTFAQELLLKVGFQYNSNNQLLDANGNRVRFTLITNAENRSRVAMAAQIKQDLSKIGIQVDLQPIAFNTLVDKLSKSLDWECHLLGFSGGVEPNNGANVWLPNGRSHYFNLQRPEGQTPVMDRQIAPWEEKIGQLYIKGAQELDETKRQAIYAEVQRLTQDNLPFIYLVNPLSLSAVRNTVKGVRYSALGGSLWNLHELKLTE